MVARLLIALTFIVILVVAGGFAVLAAWDIPVRQEPVEKILDSSKYL